MVRSEDFDTLENRVLKDFLSRAIVAARLYIRQFRDKHKENTRCKAVERFRRRCVQLLVETPLRDVRALRTIPQPNYVLQHDRTYRKLWAWYLKLVHRQRQTDEAWRWQRRLWADVVRLCTGAALHNFSTAGYRAEPLFAHDLWVRDEQANGCWLSPIDWPGPVLITDLNGKEVIAQTVHPASLPSKGLWGTVPISDWVGMAGADMAVVFAPTGAGSASRRACLFIWAIHSAQEVGVEERVMNLPRNAQRALRRLMEVSDANVAMRGLIFRSQFTGQTSDLATSGHAEKSDDAEVYGLAMPADPREWQEGTLDLVSTYICECVMECYRGR